MQKQIQKGFKVDLKDGELWEIFCVNVVSTFSLIWIIPLITIKITKKFFKTLSIRKYFYLLFIISYYSGPTILYTSAYWKVYHIYSLTKFSAIKYFWGVTIFHTIFEIGIRMILIFEVIKLMLYFYNNISYKPLQIVEEESYLLFQKTFKYIPVTIIILFIAAIIENMDFNPFH